LKLVVGDLTPSEGQVLVNDQNILNLQDVRSSLFGILDQQPYLFDTTVMNNVRLGNIHATDQQVKDAIAAVDLKDLIESLPDQYDTQVQEAGKRFYWRRASAIVTGQNFASGRTNYYLG